MRSAPPSHNGTTAVLDNDGHRFAEATDNEGQAVIAWGTLAANRDSAFDEGSAPGRIPSKVRQPGFMQIFSETIAEILAGPLTVGPANDEARDNTRTLSISADTARSLTDDQVAAFVEEARSAFSSVAPRRRSGSLRFYAWVDKQAGQLRLSVSSAESLPFGSEIRETTDVRAVARQLLGSPYLDGIPWTELRETTDVRLGEPTTVAPPLQVYVVLLEDD